LEHGGTVHQETLGWDENAGTTYSQRGKEEAHDYRYFPEPDLPPVVVEQDWIDTVRAGLPELPGQKRDRFLEQYGLSPYIVRQLVEERPLQTILRKSYDQQPVSIRKLLRTGSPANYSVG
jgi:aspartyl-tRNA(Asn)/glutamyl-tRNA(Gln) amidotransferase subunit B